MTVVKFRQELSDLVDSVGEAGVCRASLEKLTSDLRESCANAARSAFVAIVESKDVAIPSVEVDGRTCRFKEAVEKNWLTPFGVATIRRRSYASDIGAQRAVPLDAAWGMKDRFLTPEVEEMVAFASALVTPCEVAQLMSKVLPIAPSATAIKRAIRNVGDFLQQHREAVEKRVDDEAPLSIKGSDLIVSWDGVMVPTRTEQKKTEWKEAGVGRLAIYSARTSDDERPTMHDSRYLAQMPEPYMETLVDQIAARVAKHRAERPNDRVAIICDGKDSIWKAASRKEFDGAVLILDFYHAAEHLAGAANAIFGEDTLRARRWFAKRRHDLRTYKNAVGNVLRALKRYEKILAPGGPERDVLRRAIKHFTKNQRRMRYREFADMGLPIGSGHVESAAKNIVNQRLKRSGMRWSLAGGQRVLNLRTLVKDDRWPYAWREYRDRSVA